MAPTLRLAVVLLLPAVSVACTWVAPDQRGRQVDVAYFGVAGHCRHLGDVSVSVAHRVAGVRRSEIKVKDELESLARNEAATLGADTIEPQGEPEDGAQRFRAYRCR
jgi:hypothetical protein